MIHRVNFSNFRPAKICKDITAEVEIGPSPWEKHLAEKKRQKTLPMIVDKKKSK